MCRMAHGSAHSHSHSGAAYTRIPQCAERDLRTVNRLVTCTPPLTPPTHLHTCSTWFFIDLIASIPFDIIVLWFVTNISSNGLIALGLLRTPRLLRLGRLLRYFDRMKGANIVRMVRELLIR